MPTERATAAESAAIEVVPQMSKSEVIDFARQHDVAVWEGRATIRKFHADDDPARATPYETVETDPNLLLTAGVTNLWKLAANIGSPTPVAWSADNAHIAVGTGTTAVAAADTGLGTESIRRPMQTGFPTVSGNVITFQSEFLTTQANVDWRELGVVSAASTGIFLNRLVGNWGTKVDSAVWIATLTVALS